MMGMRNDEASRVERDLALFDFDGTITKKDTYMDFVKLSVSRTRLAVGMAAMSPLVAAYRLGLLSRKSMRRYIAFLAFRGVSTLRLRTVGQQFAQEVLPRVLRPEMLQRIQWHKERGDTVVIVSAALDVYMEEWCRANDLALICSRLQERRGRFTGTYLGADCCDEEKARRVLEHYALASFREVFAYGDTTEDAALLNLATHRYFRGVNDASGERLH